ncbi:MAG: hypothetical protein E3J86_15295, partial [Candidatus Thorarchaeota archaeon]
HYYDARPDLGNQLLDDLGFYINSTTGFRLAPNGDEFDIEIEYSSLSEIGGGVAQIGVDALQSLHIDASKKLFSHHPGYPLNYDMIFFAINYNYNDVEWLAYEYWSEYADDPDQNPSGFRNATYDSWRDQLFFSVTYEEVYEAAAEMQKILHYNVPRLVVYEKTYMQGYRNDQFTDHVEDLGKSISGPWTMRKIQRLDGSRGGTVSIAISEIPDSFNIFVTNSAYSIAIIENLWSSLYSLGPDLVPYPDLAESLLVETHADNDAVPEGHTRFTMDVVQNATWSDGTPLTADDVAFTQTYIIETGVYGNPAALDQFDLVAAYAPSPYRVVLEYNSESYWNFPRFAYDFIIPKHIFNDIDGIGYDGWSTWNPVFDYLEPHVTSGPFIFTDFEIGEFYEISANTNFAYFPQSYYNSPEEHDPSTSATPGNDPDLSNSITLVSSAIAGAATVVIIVMVVEILRHKHGGQN